MISAAREKLLAKLGEARRQMMAGREEAVAAGDDPAVRSYDVRIAVADRMIRTYSAGG